jgi:glycine dehydrogenase subunit 1
MGGYLPNTESQRKEMLDTVGVKTASELYASAPSGLLCRGGLDIPQGKAELEAARFMADMAGKNVVFKDIFRGAGAYRHYIPAIVSAIVNKESFVTAYTPYQPEISQGVLQSIFEYQSMIAELTGLDASNASVYDGATAAAEAVAMCRDRKRIKTLISAAAHPEVIETVKTYCWAAGYPVEIIPTKDGVTDLAALAAMCGTDTACVYLPQPNYYGLIEDAEKAGEIAHKAGAKLIMGINPIAAALLKTPGECGADIAVGEGQPLGMPLSFGGPYLGFIAAVSSLARKLPGRIVGETTDKDGNRAFVLTLQAREQHIRREKASSNICSNQALCAMTAAVYLAAMGPAGVKEAALQSMSKAHYLAAELSKLPGLALKYQGEFFHEFVTDRPQDAEKIMAHLQNNGILGGLLIEDGILWCATEMNSKESIDKMVSLIKEARA